MIVYNATKAQFNDDVNLNRISDIILENLRKKNISGGQTSEYPVLHPTYNGIHYGKNVRKSQLLDLQKRLTENASNQ